MAQAPTAGAVELEGLYAEPGVTAAVGNAPIYDNNSRNSSLSHDEPEDRVSQSSFCLDTLSDELVKGEEEICVTVRNESRGRAAGGPAARDGLPSDLKPTQPH